MTSIFRSIVHSSIRKSIQLGSAVQQVLSNTWVFLTSTADFTFTRASDQYGIDSGGNLVKSTANDPAFISGEGILLEAAATNLLEQSEDFADAYWSKTGVTITSDAVASLIPGSFADKLVEDSSTGFHQLFRSVVLTNADYTLGWLVKSVERSNVQIVLANNTVVNFDLVAKTAGANGKIQELVNGWFMCSVSDTVPDAVARAQALRVGQSPGVFSYTGDGTSGMYAIAAQLETGSFPTSYIATAGATATRAATSLTRAWQFPVNGISDLVIWRPQYDATDDKGSDLTIINLSDGTENNYLRVTADQTNDQIHLKKRVSAGTEVVVSIPAAALNYVKGQRIAAGFVADSNGLDLWVDDLAKVSIATGDAPTDWTTKLTTIELGASFQTVESSRVWNQANPDSQMESLT